MESFFSSMKREELYRTKFKSEKEFRDALTSISFFAIQSVRIKNSIQDAKTKRTRIRLKASGCAKMME